MSERLGDDTTVPAPPRRRVDATHRALAVAVAVFALLVLATTIVASWNPWRYVVLFPLGRPLGALCGYAGAVGLLGSAGLLGLAGVGRRVIASLAVATFVLGLVSLLLPWWWLDSAVGPGERRGAHVFDVSPSGDHEVIGFIEASGAFQVMVRSRAGLFSQESVEPLATCAYDPFARADGDQTGPESVRFTAETTVAVPIAGSDTQTVAFDPEKLLPQRTVDMCPGLPD